MDYEVIETTPVKYIDFPGSNKVYTSTITRKDKLHTRKFFLLCSSMQWLGLYARSLDIKL